jgi:RNA polymerase sigma-70 factor, ECF subfamily
LAERNAESTVTNGITAGQTPPEPSETENRQLLAAAIAGDSVALQRLLLRYQSRLLARLRRRMPRELQRVVAAEDIFQECLIDIFRKISSFHPDGGRALERWLITITDNRLIDAIRMVTAAKRGGGWNFLETPNGQSTVIPLLEWVRVDSHTPSRSVAAREAESGIRDALAALKDEYREAVRLRFLEGLDIAEVAIRMKRTPWSVHKLCTRGLRQLERLLGSKIDAM